ncbi:hypothetical protein MTR66_17885 [Novosphingobium sp. 2638]|uniref:Uncharacterized protein n=1 Tax=Novosphingobium beihaiensis TaxID=2930389 RepID=A0ABT0BUJ0_9SPHN|nr:hypothetical protein [Novosphingobium beihaiensis]MCJ2188677.1 hypothetical protein [Novosphingobium beihaiensis]
MTILSSPFVPSDFVHQFGWADLGDRPPAKFVARQFDQPTILFQRARRDLFLFPLCEQLFCHLGEAVFRPHTSFDPRLPLGGIGIDVMGEQPARLGQCELRIRADSQFPLHAVPAVSVSAIEGLAFAGGFPSPQIMH